MTATWGAIGRIDYTGGVRTNTTIPLPTGSGGVFVAHLVTALATAAPTITVPSGWTQLGTDQIATDGAGFFLRGILATAPGTETNNTFLHASANSEGAIIRVTGAGTLSVDVFSQNAFSAGGGNSVITALGVTPLVANDLLLYIATNWDEAALTPPTGMTERQDSQFIYIASQALGAIAATGNKTNGPNGTNPFVAYLVAVKDVAAAGGRMKVYSGSAWAEKPTKVWTGSAWVEKPVKVWTGSAWVLA